MPSSCPDPRRRRALALAGAALLLCAACGCFPPDYGPAPFACRTSPRCPEGYSCIHGVCRQGGGPTDAGPAADIPTAGDGPGVADGPSVDGGGCVNPTWAKLPLVVAGVELERVWGTSSLGLYALGWVTKSLYVVLHRPAGGKAWSSFSTAQLTSVPWDLWGTGSTDLHLIEDQRVRRYAGGAWKLAYDPPGQAFLNSIWSTATTGPYVVSEQGELFVFDRAAKAWSLGTTLPGATPSSIWGPATGAGTAFYVGSYEGRIYACTAAGAAVSCSLMTTPAVKEIHRLWGADANNVYAVGADRTVLRFDGVAWKLETSTPNGATLYGVWGSGPSQAYAVGRGGVILRRAGGAWSAMASGTGYDVRSVWGTGPRDVVAVGSKVMLELRCQ